MARSELLREALHRYLVKLSSEDDANTWNRIPPSSDEQSFAEAADWGPAEDWSDWADRVAGSNPVVRSKEPQVRAHISYGLSFFACPSSAHHLPITADDPHSDQVRVFVSITW